MRILTKLFTSNLLMLIISLNSLGADNAVKIGYLYPSGGQKGTTFRITVGGQYLKKVNSIHFLNDGIKAKVIGHSGGLSNLKPLTKKAFGQIIKKIRDARVSEFNNKFGSHDDLSQFIEEFVVKQDKPIKKQLRAMLKHPMLRDIQKKSLRELGNIASFVFFPKQMQQKNRQLAEVLDVEVTIGENVECGNYELRVKSAGGISNPLIFQVGAHPEVLESEPNNKSAFEPIANKLKLYKNVKLPKGKPIDLPAILNGQIMPGDVDRFRFVAKGGEKLVIAVAARQLIPYLADAVPGWFQATISLYDGAGKKIAYADDFQFNPDPVLFFNIEKAGEYELEIRDSIYRGREDFVYRISVGEDPFITSIFPLGGEVNSDVLSAVHGWNLPQSMIKLKTNTSDTQIRHTHLDVDDVISNEVSYIVDTIPSVRETVTSVAPANVQDVSLPIVIDGNILNQDDKDTYSFNGEKGDKVVLEVFARRLNSPLDSFVRLLDNEWNVVAMNDDHVLKDGQLYKDTIGIATHHADSYIFVTLPKTGRYYVEIVDSRRHGGVEYNYRLRISKPIPDFAIRITPSTLKIRPGAVAPIDIHILKKDGFDVPIKLSLGDINNGFTLNSSVIPAGCDRFTTTILAPVKGSKEPFFLNVQGTADIDGEKLVHKAVPADDTMQAFLFRHLVPADEFIIAVPKQRRPIPQIKILNKKPIILTHGSSVKIEVSILLSKMTNDLKFKFKDAPSGIEIGEIKRTANGFSFDINAESNMKYVGRKNLVVEAYKLIEPRQKEGKPKPKIQKVTFGYLPVIPVVFEEN